MKKRIVLIFVLLLLVLLGACSRGNKDKAGGKIVNIYYINTKTSGVVSENYELIGTKKEEQIEELLYMVKKTPKNMVYKSAIPEKVTIKDYQLDENGSLIVNFDSSYSELSGIDEVLCRAVLVKTLSQINRVEIIQINANGQPQQASNGDFSLTEEDFVFNTEASTNYKATLYFANEAGDALIGHNTDINYAGSETIEELVIKQLINGPTEIGMYDTIPKDTILLDVNMKEGICYVDFNEKFLEKLPDIDADIAIYSVVNTLVELPGISKVQFTINNKVVKTYWEDTAFDVSFERKLDLIKEEK